MNYPAIILHPKREQSWLFGHPWIFSRAIQQAPLLDPGSLISLTAASGKCLGVGYYHPKQTIAIRMLTKESVTIDKEWFIKKLSLLRQRREQWLTNTTAYRLCYGESDGIAGLVIDLYGDIAAVQVNTKGIEKLLPAILEALQELGIRETSILGDSISAKKEGVTAHLLPAKTEVEATENGLSLIISLQGQKTGWFCDQRENRYKVMQLKPTSVLNLFSYTGGFSLFALQGGAKRVVNVDQDASALALFEKMVKKNGLTGDFESICSNVWDYLQRGEELFDLVIVDPPAFVKEERKKKEGLKGYLDLIKMSIPRVQPGGFLMLYSCSHFVKEEDFLWVLRQAYASTNRFFQTICPLTQACDHPVPAFYPEAAYLKGYLLQDNNLLS